MLKKLQNTKGFTMAELLLTTFIIGIMAVSYISVQNNANSRRNQTAFQQEINTLNSSFRAIRNYAISNTAFDTDGDGVATIPESNLGIYINDDDGQFAFFIDTSDGSAEGGEPNLEFDYTDDANDLNDDFIIESLGNAHGFFDLDNRTNILSIRNENTLADPLDEAVILFAPSSSDMIINDNNAANSYNELSIVLLFGPNRAEISTNKVSQFFVTEFSRQ